MSLVVVSGYTPEYAAHGKRLVRELAAFPGLAFSVSPWPTLGDWRANCRQKAAELARVQEETGRAVLWVDADATVRRRPDETLEGDFAACPSRAGIGRRWCSGTLYFDRSEAGRILLARWRALCEAAGDATDERLLNDAFENWRGVAHRLPREYGWLPKDGKPHAGVVVVHRLSGNARRSTRPSAGA